MHLAAVGLGLDLTGLQRQVAQPGWFARGPRGLWHPTLIFPSVPSPPSARKSSAPLEATHLPYLSAFGFFIHDTVDEAGC